MSCAYRSVIVVGRRICVLMRRSKGIEDKVEDGKEGPVANGAPLQKCCQMVAVTGRRGSCGDDVRQRSERCFEILSAEGTLKHVEFSSPVHDLTSRKQLSKVTVGRLELWVSIFRIKKVCPIITRGRNCWLLVVIESQRTASVAFEVTRSRGWMKKKEKEGRTDDRSRDKWLQGKRAQNQMRKLAREILGL